MATSLAPKSTFVAVPQGMFEACSVKQALLSIFCAFMYVQSIRILLLDTSQGKQKVNKGKKSIFFLPNLLH
ncbi:MAG: hypothetical protein EA343_14885 [Nodularia sp. (in: Bacteria)]|nr:MAG: hypothetical protein EA343_14885 [Nodularia sp. (in: cyanobacteria)]